MLLKGLNISLRALEPTDLELIYFWENDPEVWKFSHTLTPFSKFVLAQYLETQHLDIYASKQLRLVVIDSNKFPVGLIDLFEFDPKNRRAGLGILIDVNARGKGFAKEALQLIEDYCFNHLDLTQVYANIGATNEKSLKLFESSGYEKVGVKKRWIKTSEGFEDEALYQKFNT